MDCCSKPLITQKIITPLMLTTVNDSPFIVMQSMQHQYKAQKYTLCLPINTLGYSLKVVKTAANTLCEEAKLCCGGGPLCPTLEFRFKVLT